MIQKSLDHSFKKIEKEKVFNINYYLKMYVKTTMRYFFTLARVAYI